VHRWLFPDAPLAPVTCNNGARSTSWFDIEDIPVTQNAKDYPADIEASVARIHTMIAELEKDGFASTEIVVGGFSQGGAMALQSVLR
jgi:lysophospholipase-2